MPSTKIVAAIVVSGLYMFLASAMVREDRRTHTGGFINLQGMMSALVTLPVAFPLEYSGHKPDYRNNWQMGGAIALCGFLVFGGLLGVISLVQWVLHAPAAPR